MISRQRRWQLKRKSEGKCGYCGIGSLNFYRDRCDECQSQLRESERRKAGSQPWRPGGPGRPPLDVERKNA